MLDATHGPEPGDAYAAPCQLESFLAQSQREPGVLKIAFSREKWGTGTYQPEVIEGLESTVALLQQLGHEVEEAQPGYDAAGTAAALFTVICVNTALAATQRAQELNCTTTELDMEFGTRKTMEMGVAVSGEAYAAAIQANQRAGRALGLFHQHYDVVLAPTLASEPIPVGHLLEKPEEYTERLFAFMGDTGLYNQTGQPSLSLPLHWSTNGLPVGMMFSAAYGDEGVLLSLAAQLEQAQPWWDRRPPVYAV
jgi:Asp-tRNA(Asn)/Glu-tRNA(Gln) amidotransferase A subunit family amidase